MNQLSRPPTKIITLDYPNHEHRQRRTSGEIAPKNIEKINFAARRSYYPAICPMDSLDTGGGGPRDANGRALLDTRPTRFGVFLPIKNASSTGQYSEETCCLHIKFNIG